MPGMMKKSAGNTERMIGYAKRTPTPKPTATKSAAPKPKATPKKSALSFAERSKAAEAELKRAMKAGKVKDIIKRRKKIAKKYGVSPNGFTN
jgi:hypothetical protein